MPAKHMNRTADASRRRRLLALMVVLLLLCCTFARFAMSLTLHMWYAPSQSLDDRLLMSYSFQTHFETDDSNTLAKNPGYGYWLLATSKLGLNADIAQFLLWLAAAVVVAYALWRIINVPTVAAAAYLYVLWNPIAFEGWLGTRLYRNSLFAPLLFLLLGMLLLWIAWPHGSGDSPKKREGLNLHQITSSILYSIIGLIVGCLFLFIMLLVENAIWCIPLLFIAIGYRLFSAARMRSPWVTKLMVCLLTLIPVLPVVGGVTLVKAVHQHYFGVSMLNTRTEGSLAGFVERLYRIDNPEQTTSIWVPASSLRQAFAVSPTLSEDPRFAHAVEHTIFAAPDIEQNPLKGDFATWQIREAYSAVFGWKDERQVQHFFDKVNKEIDDAFTTGRLHKTSKISLSPMLVPRTPAEMANLIGPSAKAWYWSLYASQYSVTNASNSSDSNPENVRGLRRMRVDIANPNPQPLAWFSYVDAQHVAATVEFVYTIVNHLLAAACLVALALSVIRMLRNKQSGNMKFLVVGLFLQAYALAYCFSVTWFTQYLDNDHVTYFYTGGVATPFVSVGLLLMAGMLCSGRLNQRAGS